MSLVDATTMMLRTLNDKINSLINRNHGSLNKDALAEIQKLMAEENAKLLTAIRQNGTTAQMEAMQRMIHGEMEVWQERQNEMGSMIQKNLNALANNVANSIKQLNKYREVIPNPNRSFVKEGVIEYIGGNISLFFPYEKNAKQPENTCMLRHSDTMEPVLVNGAFQSLMKLKKDDPLRMLTSYSIVPVGDIGSSKDFTPYTAEGFQQLVSMTGMPLSDVSKYVTDNMPRTSEEPSMIHGPSPYLDSSTNQPVYFNVKEITPDQNIGENAFNATLFLAFFKKKWKLDIQPHERYVIYWEIAKDIHNTTNAASDLTYLWEAALRWKTYRR